MDAPGEIQGSIHVLAVIVIQCVQDSGYISKWQAFYNSLCIEYLKIILFAGVPLFQEDV